jgi:hypothetical protein
MIIERIKRKIEKDLLIVPQSTPIIYFGNYDKAKACTISLNPSNKEFVDGSNILLDNRHLERLCTRKQLHKSDNEELTDNDAEIVLEYCNNYFKKRPFNMWFKPFDYFIKKYGDYSYYDDTCVHLDLVQWATSDKWSVLSPLIRQKHLDNDLHVLKYLLNKNFETMFLNGKTVVDSVSKCLNINLTKKTIPFINANGKTTELTISHGRYNQIEVIGWNVYLQSASVGGNENKHILCDLIKKNI